MAGKKARGKSKTGGQLTGSRTKKTMSKSDKRVVKTGDKLTNKLLAPVLHSQMMTTSPAKRRSKRL